MNDSKIWRKMGTLKRPSLLLKIGKGKSMILIWQKIGTHAMTPVENEERNKNKCKIPIWRNIGIGIGTLKMALLLLGIRKEKSFTQKRNKNKKTQKTVLGKL